MAATAVAVTTAAAIMGEATMAATIMVEIITAAGIVAAAIMVEVITAAAITAAIIMVDTTARTGAAMLFIMAHIGAATVTAATGTAAGGGAVTASARAGAGLLPGMFGSATKMINGKPAPAGFPSSRADFADRTGRLEPGCFASSVFRNNSARPQPGSSFHCRVRGYGHDRYPATTAIGVISTMISGTAKLAAVSKVLAGKSLP